jgi:tetratricopeptide (TPR) repeat protein
MEKRRGLMKNFKNLRKRFYQPWILRVLVVILAVSNLPSAGRYASPGNGPMVSGQTVEDLIKQGDVLSEQRRYDEAIAAFTKAIELNPRNSVAFNKRGYIKFLKHDYESAIADYGKAILLDPMDYAAYYGRSQAYLALKRYTESLEDCETAISISPQDASALDLRSRIKRETKDYSMDDLTKIRSAQKEILTIATALADYITDKAVPPAISGAYDENSTFYKSVSPMYIKILPVKDPWGNNYLVYCGTAINGHYGITGSSSDDFMVVSLGKDGTAEMWEYNPSTPEAGLYTEIDATKDLVNFNGSFIRGLRIGK